MNKKPRLREVALAACDAYTSISALPDGLLVASKIKPPGSSLRIQEAVQPVKGLALHVPIVQGGRIEYIPELITFQNTTADEL